MLAQNAIQLCPDTLNSAAALMIHKMGAKLDGKAIEALERMCQQ